MEGSAQQGGVVNGTQVEGCRQPCKDSTGVRINYLGGLLTPSVIRLRATTLKRILPVEICMYVKNFTLIIVKLVFGLLWGGDAAPELSGAPFAVSKFPLVSI